MVKKNVFSYTAEPGSQAVSLCDQPGKTAVEIVDSVSNQVNQIYN